MLQNYKTYHLKKRKKKNWETLEKRLHKGKYILQSYQGGYVNIKSFVILILAFDQTNSPHQICIKYSAKFFGSLET